MDWLANILGLKAAELTPLHMSCRAVVVFFVCLAYVRVGGIRTFGKSSTFDQLTALIFGAVMGRSIVATSSFPGALLASLIIMLLHRMVAFVTYKSHKLGKLLKGRPLLLWSNGRLIENNAAAVHITAEDMREAMRVLLTVNDLEKVEEIYLERSGEISVIKKDTPVS